MTIDWAQVADVAGAVCFIAGALLAFFAALGVLRFPDIFARMHAATKPQVLGLFLVLIGIALILRNATATWVLLLVAFGQMLTAPVSAHMIGRASFRTGVVRHKEFVVDELSEDVQRVQEEWQKHHEHAKRGRGPQLPGDVDSEE